MAPDLTGYGSRDWLLAFIANPAADRFYGKQNDRMPAFAPHEPGSPQNQLSPETIGLIADWLRHDWDRRAGRKRSGREIACRPFGQGASDGGAVLFPIRLVAHRPLHGVTDYPTQILIDRRGNGRRKARSRRRGDRGFAKNARRQVSRALQLHRKRRQQLHAILGDQVVVLQAYAFAELGAIEPRLDRDHFAFFERVVPGGIDVGRFVRIRPMPCPR